MFWAKRSNNQDDNSRFIAERSAELRRVAGRGSSEEKFAGTMLVIAAGRELGAHYLREGGTVPFESLVNDALGNLWKNAVVGAEGKVPAQFLRAKNDGSELNDCGDELRHLATARFGENDTLIILTSAAGRQVAEIFLRNGGAVQIEELLSHACDSVREHAYIGAPQVLATEPKELTEQQFGDLSARIMNTATTNTSVVDSVAATAKALGTLAASMIHFGHAKPGTSLEDVIVFAQNAVAEFTREAMAKLKANTPSKGE